MTPRSKLSIIILSYNTQPVLAKCLASLEKGLGKLASQTELIVADNGSQDGSVDWLKKYRQQEHSLGVELIFNKDNLGFSRGVNQALKKATGEWLLLLNSDIICRADSIKKMFDWAQEKARLGAVGGRLLNTDGSPQPSVYRLPTLKRAISQFWLGQGDYFDKHLPQKSGEVEAVVGAVMLLPQVSLRNGLIFDEKYFMYFEDLDLCRRLRKEGKKVYYYSEAEFVHYHGQSGKGQEDKVNRYLEESSVLYYGWLKKQLIDLVIRSGTRWQKIKRKK